MCALYVVGPRVKGTNITVQKNANPNSGSITEYVQSAENPSKCRQPMTMYAVPRCVLLLTVGNYIKMVYIIRQFSTGRRVKNNSKQNTLVKHI